RRGDARRAGERRRPGAAHLAARSVMEMERKVAFILAGGASRGAYQAGCLKRLEEEGITPDLIIGSSIGVCNALVYETGGPEALWGFWERAVSLPQVLDVSLRHNPLRGNSFFSMDRLQRFIEDAVDLG